MKVLVVGPDLNDPGGVSNYYNAVFARLLRQGVEAYYLEIGSTHGGKSVLHIIEDQVRFWKTITRFQPDIIHLNPSLVPKSFFRDGLFVFLSKMRKRRVLIFFHGWKVSFERQVSGRFKWFFRKTYSHADMFIVLASRFAASIRQWGISSPVYLASTSVDDEVLLDYSIDEKISDLRSTECFRLLFMARLEHKKGVIELIRAVMLLIDRGLPVDLTIAGDGPAMREVQQLIDTGKKYSRKIHITGYVRSKRKFEILRSHHIFCFPTQYDEGMPISIIEAMIFGMPVITCPVGGIADFFEDGSMGTLVNGEDSDEIANAIRLMILDRTKCGIIARYNHEYALQKFLASSAASMLNMRYEEILAKNVM